MPEGIQAKRHGNEHRLELTVDSEAVARLTIVDRRMRLGDTWVRMGGLASVRTNPAQRGKGYGRQLMEKTLGYMREEGFLVSLLFGIPGFYDRFGYATTMPRKSLVTLRTSQAERLGGDLAVREAGLDDRSALVAIYETANREQNGALERTINAFSPWADGSDDWFQERRSVLVAEDGGGPVAYALGEKGWDPASKWGGALYEIAVLGETAFTAGPSLLRALAVEAAEQRSEWLAFEMVPDAPLAAVLRDVGYKQEVEYSSNQGGMGRIIDLSGLAAALTGTVARRLREEAPLKGVGTVVLDCGDEQAEIACGRGRTVSVKLPQQTLFQLLMGYRSIAELRRNWPGCVADEELAAVDALFSAGFPYMWRLDHF